jgi:hypothetical protein
MAAERRFPQYESQRAQMGPRRIGILKRAAMFDFARR